MKATVARPWHNRSTKPHARLVHRLHHVTTRVEQLRNAEWNRGRWWKRTSTPEALP